MPVAEERIVDYVPSLVMPNDYDVRSTEIGLPDGSDSRGDKTPTNERPRELHLNTTNEYSPVELSTMNSPESPQRPEDDMQWQMRGSWNSPPEPYNPYDPSLDNERQAEDFREYDSIDESPIQTSHPPFSGLRVANRSGSDDSDWTGDALRSLNIRNS